MDWRVWLCPLHGLPCWMLIPEASRTRGIGDHNWFNLANFKKFLFFSWCFIHRRKWIVFTATWKTLAKDFWHLWHNWKRAKDWHWLRNVWKDNLHKWQARKLKEQRMWVEFYKIGLILMLSRNCMKLARQTESVAFVMCWWQNIISKVFPIWFKPPVLAD